MGACMLMCGGIQAHVNAMLVFVNRLEACAACVDVCKHELLCIDMRAYVHTKHCCPACTQTPAELAGFLQYAVALHRAHMLLCQRVDPVPQTSPRDLARRAELLEGHKRCAQRDTGRGGRQQCWGL